MFPSLALTLHYEEPGCYFAGDIFGENGECIHDEYDNERCEELFSKYDDEDDHICD